MRKLFNFCRNLIETRIRAFSNTRFAMPFVFFIGYIEAIIFPIPQEVFMVPMMLSEKAKVFRIVFFSILGSIIGGLTAYYLGLLFFDSLVMPIINFYNYSESFLYFKNQINEYGFIYVFIGGFTPLPFKIITLSSGALNIPIWNFLLAATLSRSIRFYLIGFLTYKYGNNVINIIDRKLNLITFIILLIVFLIYFTYKLIL
ncbi:VTT domain-containing protein [Pelagibacteraceae bacterium]|jgi:membrane protein YqaA with SNARE-associated domain|nr:VTT domain-containing protein [Pelagibacteraceae bacterium]MDC3171750.1 VTT domain-containing protein [Pelagibacteraceae bacterium]